jgi:hypothetical protein
MKRALRTGACIAVISILSGCIYVPTTVRRYDPSCRIVQRQMVLEQVQIATLQDCGNQQCMSLLIAASFVSAASVVVSGTIALSGNVVYWLEERAQCATGP